MVNSDNDTIPSPYHENVRKEIDELLNRLKDIARKQYRLSKKYSSRLIDLNTKDGVRSPEFSTCANELTEIFNSLKPLSHFVKSDSSIILGHFSEIFVTSHQLYIHGWARAAQQMREGNIPIPPHHEFKDLV